MTDSFLANGPAPAGANDLSQSLGVVLIRLIYLHLEGGADVPSVETNDFKSESAEFMHKPWRHRASLDPNAGVIPRMSTHRCGNLFRRRGALATPQSAPDIVDDANGCHFLRNVQTPEVGHHCGNLRWRETPGNAARIAALSDDRAPHRDYRISTASIADHQQRTDCEHLLEL